MGSREQFMEQLRTVPVTIAERLWDPEVRVTGNLAAVWAPYDLHMDGE